MKTLIQKIRNQYEDSGVFRFIVGCFLILLIMIIWTAGIFLFAYIFDLLGNTILSWIILIFGIILFIRLTLLIERKL